MHAGKRQPDAAGSLALGSFGLIGAVRLLLSILAVALARLAAAEIVAQGRRQSLAPFVGGFSVHGP